MINLRNPRQQIIVLLFILFLITMFHLSIGTSILLLVLSVGGAAVFDCLFARIKKQELRIPYSGIITGLILALIVDPAASWWQILIIAAFVWFTISLSFIALICSLLIFAAFAFVVWLFYNTLRNRSLRHATACLTNFN